MRFTNIFSVLGLSVVVAGCGDNMPMSCEQLLDKTEYLSKTLGKPKDFSRERLEATLKTIRDMDTRDAHCRNALNALRLIER